jgi:hypothetical protein
VAAVELPLATTNLLPEISAALAEICEPAALKRNRRARLQENGILSERFAPPFAARQELGEDEVDPFPFGNVP